MLVHSSGINNLSRKIKKHLMDIFVGELPDIYEECCTLVSRHLCKKLIMPCCGKTCPPGSYTLNGTYKRRRPITDVCMDKDGTFHIKVYEDFEIQLIECTHRDGHTHTHALLFDLLTPYDSYTLRAKFYFVQRFLESDECIEDFCAEHQLPLLAFKRWRAWIRSHISWLFGIGNRYAGTRKHLSREALQQFYDYFKNNYLAAFIRTVDLFNASVFQTRATPAHSVKLCGRPLL